MASRERAKELRVSMTTLKWLEREAKWTSVTPVSMTTHMQLLRKVCTYAHEYVCMEWLEVVVNVVEGNGVPYVCHRCEVSTLVQLKLD